MKTSSFVVRVSALLCSCVLPICRGEPATAKPFTLFAGTDFAVDVDGQPRPIVGAAARSVIVRVEQKTKEIPLASAKEIRVSAKLKLANVSAQVRNVTGVLSSDAAREKQFKALEAATAMDTNADAMRDRAQGEFMRADMSAAALSNTKGPPNDPDFRDRLIGGIHQEQYRAFQNTSNAATQQQSLGTQLMVNAGANVPNRDEGVEITPQVTNQGVALAGLADASARQPSPGGAVKVAIPKNLVDASGGNADRFDLEFEVSAVEGLDRAYAVVVTDFIADRNGQPRSFRRIGTQRIGRIQAKPTKVSISQTGFPAGFRVTDYRVALFAGGQEVPTNFIENQAALSEDEAYQYLVDRYLASHKGETRPPAAMLMRPQSRVNATDATALRQPVYVFVDPTGKVIKVTLDAAGSAPGPTGVIAALESFRFIPALDKGLPVAGRAKLVVADFLP